MFLTLNSWGEEIHITGLKELLKTGDFAVWIAYELIGMRVIAILLVEWVRIEVDVNLFESRDDLFISKIF